MRRVVRVGREHVAERVSAETNAGEQRGRPHLIESAGKQRGASSKDVAQGGGPSDLELVILFARSDLRKQRSSERPHPRAEQGPTRVRGFGGTTMPQKRKPSALPGADGRGGADEQRRTLVVLRVFGDEGRAQKAQARTRDHRERTGPLSIGIERKRETRAHGRGGRGEERGLENILGLGLEPLGEQHPARHTESRAKEQTPAKLGRVRRRRGETHRVGGSPRARRRSERAHRNITRGVRTQRGSDPSRKVARKTETGCEGDAKLWI